MVAATSISGSQLAVLVAGAYPSSSVRTSQIAVEAAVTVSTTVKSSQLAILVAGQGFISNPAVRVFTFTIDGHDFYVLRLGNDETLVYDCASQVWSTWGSNDDLLWKANTGTNWNGGNAAGSQYGSNVIVGDDLNGALYFLSPLGVTDDDAISGSSLQRPYLREGYAQVPAHGYARKRFYNFMLRGSIGAFSTAAPVTLQYSDDSGNTYVTAGDVTVNPGDYTGRIQWRSLGSFKYPGRLFKVTDHGAMQRLDSIDVEVEE